MNTKPTDAAMPYTLNSMENDYAPGLTKREYFAGLALQGLMANGSFSDTNFHDIAKWSIQQADALINQLNQNDNGTV